MSAIVEGQRPFQSVLPIILLFGVMSLAGCFGGHVVVGDKGAFDPTEGVFAPDLASSLKDRVHLGVTSRSDIRKLLGTPVASSETWQIEFYRIDHEDAYTIFTGAVVLPLPIPLFFPTWSETATQTVYALVVYDQSWTVSAFDTGYYVEAIHTGHDVKGIHDRRNLRKKGAVAGGFQFDVYWWGELKPSMEFLYAPNVATKAVLSADAKPGRCTVHLVNSGVRIPLYFDGEIISHGISERLRNGFFAVSVLPGKHEIKASISHSWLKGESIKEVSCSEGQRLFVEIKGEEVSERTFFKPATATAKFEVENEPSAVFKACRLVLYHNRKWIGPEKPHSD